MKDIPIILVNPSHPGNMGAAARAIKNMGLHELRLVKPQRALTEESFARASGADDILHNAVFYENFANAMADCQLVIGTSARCKVPGVLPLTPREAAALAAHSPDTEKVAFVFGREHAGLSNDELALCQYHVQIPCNPDFSSLNIAAAVQISCYELRLALSEKSPGETKKSPPLASQTEIENLFTHLESTLADLDFYDPNNPRRLMQKLRALFNRTQLQASEVNILRGILSAVDGKIR